MVWIVPSVPVRGKEPPRVSSGSRTDPCLFVIIGATGENKDDVRMSLQAAAEGRFKALIDCVLPLSQAARAHEIVESRAGVGKVILEPTRL